MITPNIFSNFQAMTEVLNDEDLYEIRTVNNATGQVLYVGKNVMPNAPTSDPTWYVKKLGYDVNGYLNRVQLPVNGLGFLYIWDDVATYFP